MGSLWKWRPPLSLQEKKQAEDSQLGSVLQIMACRHWVGRSNDEEKHGAEGCTAETIEAKEK